jgi:A/G-specific adenine glycosylase
MPWKGEKEPYKIWISEIILQQTRVLQGLAYYDNFINQFPTVKSLATAPDEAVFKAWEGLGYYTRCKNLILTARNIVNNYNGDFPKTYENILALKGIGPYTAAAISSFAYGLPHAVVDGNVLRVLARFFGEALSIDSVKGKQYFTKLANELLFREDSGGYNQAIMDFGATVCKPQIPACDQCVLKKDCIAYKRGQVNLLPVKEKQLAKKKRWFNYFIFTLGNKVLVNKRVQKDIWENLHEFYLFETDGEWEWTVADVENWLHDQFSIEEFKIEDISKVFKQQLTHQNLHGRFISVSINDIPVQLQYMRIVDKEELWRLAFPKFINQYLLK